MLGRGWGFCASGKEGFQLSAGPALAQTNALKTTDTHDFLPLQPVTGVIAETLLGVGTRHP